MFTKSVQSMRFNLFVKHQWPAWASPAYRTLARVMGYAPNKLGAQCQFDSSELLRYNRTVKPAAILVINVTKREFLEQLIRDNPGVKIIYRHYPDSSWADNPEHQAAVHVGRLCEEIELVSDLIHAVVDNNEYVHAHQSDLHPFADRYMAAFIELCYTKLGKDPVVLNASTGNFGDDLASCFPKMLQALQQWGGFIGWHEYDYSTMWRAHEQGLVEGNEGMWHCLRWKRAARAIREAMGGWCPQFIITECGLDSHVIPELTNQPHKGFRDVYPDDLGRTVEHYMVSTRWYYDNFDDDLFAAIIFGCGMVSPWGPFDIGGTDIPDRIALFPVPEPEPPPEPNGGNDVIRVYDFDHSPFEPGAPYKDMAWLRSIFGDVQIHPIENHMALQVGQLIAKIAWLDCRVGDTSIMLHVDDQAGNPQAGFLGVFGWPDAEPHGLPLDWPLWTLNGAVGDPTEANGDIGLGSYGEGAYYGPDKGERGPHFLWLFTLPSDMVDGMGMLTWAPGIEGNHLHFNVGYKVEVYTGDQPEPPVPPDDLNEEIRQIGLRMQQDGARLVEISNMAITGLSTMTLTMKDGTSISYRLMETSGSVLAAVMGFFKR